MVPFYSITVELYTLFFTKVSVKLSTTYVSFLQKLSEFPTILREYPLDKDKRLIVFQSMLHTLLVLSFDVLSFLLRPHSVIMRISFTIIIYTNLNIIRSFKFNIIMIMMNNKFNIFEFVENTIPNRTPIII